MREQAARDAHGLRIVARRDVSMALAGAYRSAYRGHGLTFEELREYNPGEDASRIEWKATARLGRPVAVQMREERDLLLALLVDVSESMDFGFAGGSKLAGARRAAAALATAALAANDRVALVTFAAGIERKLPPASGSAQLARALEVLCEPPQPGPTNAAPALTWAWRALPRHSVVVLLSDMLFDDPEIALAGCARKHDLTLLRIADPADQRPGRSAPVRVISAESGLRTRWRRPGRRARARREPPEPLPEAALRIRGAAVGVLRNGPDLIPSLHHFFESRARRTR